MSLVERASLLSKEQGLKVGRKSLPYQLTKSGVAQIPAGAANHH